MKKLILILLACAMLMSCIVCFVSCDKKEPVLLEKDGEGEETIYELSTYLRRISASINPRGINFENKIEWVRNSSTQALHVAFDPKDYYFVCAYYNSDHNEDKFCCVNEYTWVMFYEENDITEHYENNNLVAAFQINKAKFVKDIVSKRSVTPEFEHFLVYTPQFKDGINIADALYCGETYIYFRDIDFEGKDYILDSIQKQFHELTIVPCTKYKGKYYIKQEMQIGYQNPIDLKPEFGKYYDDLMEIMITDKYTEEIDGKTYYYGLFDIKEFTKTFWK